MSTQKHVKRNCQAENKDLYLSQYAHVLDYLEGQLLNHA